MAPISLSSTLSTDASNPSISEHVICHRWEGPKYAQADGNFTQWTKKLKDALILNGIYAHVFDIISPRPDPSIEPRMCANWGLNDRLAITFIKSALDDAEHRDLITDQVMQQPSARKGEDNQQTYLDIIMALEQPVARTASHSKGLAKDTQKLSVYKKVEAWLEN
ncbi:hypothetical protein C0995_000821 [Termitomyces sp. Mi166|nr:hypothetical protein C0995_000821 [Termitomyces sp. Mi166\